MGGGDKRSPLSLVKPKPRNGSPSSRVGRRRSSGRTRFIFIKPEHAEQVAKRGSVCSASCLSRARKQVKFLPRGENKCPRISQPFYLSLVDVRPPCIYKRTTGNRKPLPARTTQRHANNRTTTRASLWLLRTQLN